MAEGPHERLKRYIEEAYDLEQGVLTSLKSAADDCKDVDPELSRMFLDHYAVTERQRDRLKVRMDELDIHPSATKRMLTNLYAVGTDIATGFRGPLDKVENNLMAAYKTEAFEMATYSALQAAAETIGDEPTARIAREIFEEERQTFDRLFPHIARHSRRTMLEAGAGSPEEMEENRTEYADKGFVSNM
jgi:ferritin-like metal-binding protein YciE